MRSPSAVSGAAAILGLLPHYSSAARSIGVPEHEDAVSLLGDRDRLRHGDEPVEGRAENLGRPVGTVDEPEPADGLSGGDGIAWLEDRLEQPVLG